MLIASKGLTQVLDELKHDPTNVRVSFDTKGSGFLLPKVSDEDPEFP